MLPAEPEALLAARLIERVAERVAYEGRLVCAFVDMTAHAMKPVPVPPQFRPLLEPDAAFAAAIRQGG